MSSKQASQSLCPVCQVPLVGGYTCEKCNGMVTGLGVFKQVCPPGLIEKTLNLARTAGAVSTRKCPKCPNQMTALAVPDVTPAVELDFCLNCQSVWFDQGELQRLPPKNAVDKQMDQLERERIRIQAEMSRERFDPVNDFYDSTLNVYLLANALSAFSSDS